MKKIKLVSVAIKDQTPDQPVLSAEALEAISLRTNLTVDTSGFRDLRMSRFTETRTGYQATLNTLNKCILDIQNALPVFDTAVGSYLKLNALLLVLSGRYDVPLPEEIKVETKAVQSQLLNKRALLPPETTDIVEELQFRTGPSEEAASSNQPASEWKKVQYVRLARMLSKELPSYRSGFIESLQVLTDTLNKAAPVIAAAARTGLVTAQQSANFEALAGSIKSIRTTSAHAIPRIIQSYTAAETQLKTLLKRITAATEDFDSEKLPNGMLTKIASSLSTRYDEIYREKIQHFERTRKHFLGTTTGKIWLCIKRFQDTESGDESPFTLAAERELSAMLRELHIKTDRDNIEKILRVFEQHEQKLFEEPGVIKRFLCRLKFEEDLFKRQTKRLQEETGVPVALAESILTGMSDEQCQKLLTVTSFFSLLPQQKGVLIEGVECLLTGSEDECIEYVEALEMLIAECPLADALLCLSARDIDCPDKIYSEINRSRLLDNEPLASFEHWYLKISRQLQSTLATALPEVNSRSASHILLQGFFDSAGLFVGSRRLLASEIMQGVERFQNCLSDRARVTIEDGQETISALAKAGILYQKRSRFSLMPPASSVDEPFSGLRSGIVHMVTILWQQREISSSRPNLGLDAAASGEIRSTLYEAIEYLNLFEEQYEKLAEAAKQVQKAKVNVQRAWKRYGVKTNPPFLPPGNELEGQIVDHLSDHQRQRAAAGPAEDCESIHLERQSLIRELCNAYVEKHVDGEIDLLKATAIKLNNLIEALDLTGLRLYHAGVTETAVLYPAAFEILQKKDLNNYDTLQFRISEFLDSFPLAKIQELKLHISDVLSAVREGDNA